jgi:hypothetical protein
MTIKDTKTVDNYCSQVMELRGLIENLSEFINTLPAPDEDHNIQGMNYCHAGSIGHIHSLLVAASEHADEYCDE